ncbi:hypothetical protein DSO57_1001359 [Entomophthora muscae]|uniref:Uncharacterized protein n=1 Tax=Entomophthora muscae TaxID=34485 RepID=A0ACC2SY26_9FUNG|nr:hypothetical protein DSO57_1001359 [Entomophthora muscae]
MLFWLTQLLPYFVFAIYQFSLRSSGPSAPLPAFSCPLGLDTINKDRGYFQHPSKLFEIVYITLTGVIDTIISVTGLWSWVGKSLSSCGWLFLQKTWPVAPLKMTGQPPKAGSLTGTLVLRQFPQPGGTAANISQEY